jgi:hypothetical protein
MYKFAGQYHSKHDALCQIILCYCAKV